MKYARAYIKILKVLCLLTLIIISCIYVRNKGADATVSSLGIVIEDSLSSRFVNQSDIVKFIQKKHGNLIGLPLDSIDFQAIEETVDSYQPVLKSEVYYSWLKNSFDPKYVLNVKIKQRKPILRIYTSGKDYYIDDTGHVIDWISTYTPRVPVASGNLSLDFARRELLPLCHFLENNSFWRAQIEQIYVNQDQDIVLISRIGNEKIILGKSDKLQQKFYHLSEYYKQVAFAQGWNKYKSINLKYSNQIVCKK